MCRMYAGQDPARYEPETRHLRLNGQSTSLRLESAFWDILDAIAAGEGLTTPGFISRLHGEVLMLHGEARNFSSILRCTCLVYLDRLGAARLAVAAE
jgi:predicted DNA-binding ribbon-helix-helix protein